MIDLDEKLEETYNDIGSSFYWEGTSGENDCEERRADFIKNIKQTLADAGWLDTNQLGGIRSTTVYSKPGVEFMIGQEWYDRLLLNMDVNRYHESDPEYAAQKSVLEAAKKAAGIE